MRWLIVLAMILALGCATLRVNAEPEIIPPPFKVIEQQGWVPMNVDGERWVLLSKRLYVIGECETLFGGYWNAKYYNHGNDFFGSPNDMWKDTNSLHECVEWVEFQALGDYYL